MRKAFLIFLFTPFLIGAQQYGNEWINFSQQYFKIPVYKTGIHRLEYSTIKISFFQAGIDISDIGINEFQVFGREKEVALFIEDEDNNGFLNGDDYIEFYAEKNSSWLDSLVYTSPDYVPDPYYSLFNDTIRYFLTWNPQGFGLRMINEDSTNFTSYSPLDYCWNKSYTKFSSDYTLGEQEDGLSSPLFEKGEGWVGPVLTKGNANTENLSTPNSFNGGPDANVRITIVSSNSAEVLPPVNPPPNNHNTKLYFNNSLIIDTSYYGYEKINFKFPATVSSTSSAIKHEIGTIGQGADRQHISEITIWYPHNLDFNGDSTFTFGVGNNPIASKSRIDFTNLHNSVNNPILYVINNEVKRVRVDYNNSSGKVLIPNTTIGDSLICFITDSLNFISVNDLSPVGSNGFFRNLDGLNLNNGYVIVSHKKLMPTAIDYGAYRSSEYDTVVVDIEELYLQFGGGIYLHPLSIKRFMHMAMNKWNSWPSHLFLLGKSISFAPQGGFSPRKQSSVFANCLVPSWGQPASDNHFTVGIVNGSEGFSIPTGRRSSSSLFSASNYLEKVQEYEAQQDPTSLYSLSNKEWQKNIIHFGGGADSVEQNDIQNILSLYEETIEDSLFGGYVNKFGKDPFSSTLNNNDFQKVAQLLEDGVSLITFFGHSSAASGFSQNIDSPDNWNNEGKYPFVFGIGCYSGDVHLTDTSVYAEALVAPRSEGAIGFVSTIKQGVNTIAGQYINFLYDFVSSKGYGQTIGQQMKMTIDSLDQFTSGIYWGPIYQGNYNGMALQGDPALKVNHHNKPEIVLDQSRVWHEPSNINLSVDTFSLYVVVGNIGRTFEDSLFISVNRQFPSGQDSTYEKTVGGVYFRDTIEFKIPTNNNISIGINNFNIKADLPISFIDEQQDEFTNNEIQNKSIVFSSNAIFPIWPYNYSIVGNQIETLKGSTMNPFEPLKTYLFEIDTTDEFNSPFKKNQEVVSVGGIIEASPNNWINSTTLSADPLFFTDSTVYFWRCAPDSSTIDWQENSFQYIPDKWGWGQSHFFQFKNNTYSNITYNRPGRSFDFFPSLSQLEVVNYVEYQTGNQINSSGIKLNGSFIDYGGYIMPCVIVGVVDPISLKHWCVDCPNGITYGSSPCDSYHSVGQYNGCPPYGVNNIGRNRRHGFFIFSMTDSTQMNSLANFLDNYIPDSSYIIAYSFIYDQFGIFTSALNSNIRENWTPQLYSAFNNLGAVNITPSSPNDGFIVYAQKGNPSSTVEIHTTNTVDPTLSSNAQLIEYETYIQGSETNGSILTKTAGPAYNWNSIYWEQHALEDPTSDSLRIKIFGIDTLSGQSLLIDTLMTPLDSINNLNNIINAQVYPKIKIEVLINDQVDLTAGQVDRIQLLYDPVPELAVNPKKGFYLNIPEEGMQQGDSGKLAIAIENISAFDMDSLLVNYTAYNENLVQYNLAYPRQDSLRAGEILMDTLTFSTLPFNNDNILWVTANPKNLLGVQDQLEQFYFNNILQKDFKILEDITNPILDITFDGYHILDNDIVSPSPNIVITLDDENEFVLLNEDTDTSSFSIHILYPNSNNWQRIYFMNSAGEEIMRFYPATSSKNKCSIEFNPSFIIDGNYSFKVQARDKNNNYSGDNEYQINFEVITESSISNVYNYPNPFSTKTHFVFTLTGSTFPDDILIQIFSVSGRVVKEINLSEIGNIKIGHNKTDYFWDGTDHYGDRLANGIYFYKVTAKINGEDIDHRETSGDVSFKKGFGKMYLFR